MQSTAEKEKKVKKFKFNSKWKLSHFTRETMKKI